MVWLALLVVFFNTISFAEKCLQELENLVQNDLIPRIFDFQKKGEGLDYLKEYPECFASNGTYAAISWIDDLMPVASYGFCLPPDCDPMRGKEIFEDLAVKYALKERIQSKIKLIKFLDLSTTMPMPTVGYIFIACFMVLLILEVSGTLYSLCFEKKLFLSHFSIIINTQNLFNGSKPSNNLDVFDGIRSLASIAIILVHSYFFTSLFLLSNRFEFNNFSKSILCSFIISLTHAVDVFFILSGFLLSFLTIKEMQNKGKNFSWIKFIVRRVIRYLPVLYFLIGVERCLDGADPQSTQNVLSKIAQTDPDGPWWSALLLIHNLFPVDGVQYLLWTWTTSIDFQFYLASCLVLIVYSRNKTWGYALITVYVSVSVFYSGYLSFVYQISPSPSDTVNNLKKMNLIYLKPIPRIAAFMVGLALGLIYLKATQKKTQVSVAYSVKDSFGEKFENSCLYFMNNQPTRKLFYIFGLLFLAFSAFGPHYLVVYGEESLGLFIKVVWVGLRRLVFAIGFSFLTFPLLFGHLTIVGSFLKLQIFNFLGKISYTMYMIHPLIFFGIIVAGNEMRKADLQTYLQQSVKLIGISVLMSSIVQVLIESPFLSLSRRYFSR